MELETLIEQLAYAVERCNGRTTITNADLAVLRKAAKELKR